ncbi:MAG: M64 family metallopeptidase [Acidimicrobiales bacterium]
MRGSQRVRRFLGGAAVVACLVGVAVAPTGASDDAPSAANGSTPEPTHLDVSIDLAGPSTRARGDAVALVDAEVAAGPAPRSRGGSPNSQQLLVVGHGPDGSERWRTSVADPRIHRLEAPDDDGHLHGTTVVDPDARLSVAAPAGLGIAELEVLETAADGRAVALGSVALPAQLASGAAAPDATASAIGDNRIDIAVLGDGYTAAQQAKFSSDVDTVMTGFFAEDPYAEYAAYFRVNQVPVVSNQSGADHLERTPPTFRDTALGAEYGCYDIDRLICVDDAKVTAAVSAALPAAARHRAGPGERHHLRRLGRPVRGGLLHPDAVELALHEIGHSFGGLADEYSGNVDDPSCRLPAYGVNVTSETNRTKIPWKHWIAGATPVPTGGSTPSLPGAYAGAAYCDAGAYRPTYDSKMRSLGSPWDQVNTEALIQQMYARVGPIDSASPAGSVIARQTSGSLTASVVPMAPRTHALVRAWTFDGAAAGSATSLSVPWSSIGSGKHEVVASVRDTTAAVRADPFDLLRETRTWRIPDRQAPFASWSAFVDQTYLDLLGRAASSGERSLWASALANGTADRADLVDSARRGSDGTDVVDPTVRLYRAFLQRTPDAGGQRFWVSRKRAGTWTITRMADHFASSSEFLRKYGTLTNRQFVTRIYTDVMGRNADPGGVDYWTRQLDLRRKSRGQVMVGFSESSEYKRKQAEITDVSVASIFLLGRAPSSAEVAAWVDRQKAGTPHRTLVLELLDSPGYATRIGG